MVYIYKNLYIFFFKYIDRANNVIIKYKIVKIQINLFFSILYAKTNYIFNISKNFLQNRFIDQIKIK